MADIWTTVKNESLANCTIPDDAEPMTIAVTNPTAAKIVEVMAELRKPGSRFKVREIADKCRVKMQHVAEIRAAMERKVSEATAPKTIEE